MAISRWREESETAAQLVAQDKFTNTEIAKQIGVTRQTLDNWKVKPEFQAMVAGYQDKFRKVVRSRGVAVVEKRVDLFNDLWNRLQAVIAERAEAPVMQDAPGGKTGLLVHSLKGLGGGDSFQVVDEFTLDTGLLKELRELSKHVAQELGQWTDRVQSEATVKLYGGFDPEEV